MVDEASHGTGRLQTDVLQNLEIPLPPLPVQRRIAEILGRLDDKIEVNRRINARWRRWRRRSTGTGSWSSGRFGMGSFVESEMGAIPKGWEMATLGDVCQVMNGATPSTKVAEYWDGGDICWATPTDMTALTAPVIFDTGKKITHLGLSNCSATLLPIGSVIGDKSSDAWHFGHQLRANGDESRLQVDDLWIESHQSFHAALHEVSC